MVLIADFEDGVESGWTGDTGSLSATTVTVLSGNQTGKLTANDESVAVTSPSAGETQAPLRFETRFSAYTSSDFDSISFYPQDSGGTRMGILGIDHGSEVFEWYDGTAYSTVASASTATDYAIKIEPDWSANTVDIYVNGTLELSGAGMENAIAGVDNLYVSNATQNSGATREVYLDDIEVLAPPTTPTLSLGTVTDTSIDLSWTSETASSYNVYRAEASGSSTADYTLIAQPGENTLSYTDTGLENGERYYYRVTSENSVGESDPSNEVAATTPLPFSGIDALDDSTEDQLTVEWTRQDNSSDGDWTVQFRETGTSGWTTDATYAPGAATSHTITGLEDGEEYDVQLTRSTDHASETDTATATTLLPAPTLDAADTSIEGEVTISWTKNDDNTGGRFEIWRATQSGARDNGSIIEDTDQSVTSYTDTDLLDGERYWYMVTRVTTDDDTVGGPITTFADSNDLDGTTVLPPPTNLSSPAHTASSIDLTWSATHNNGDTRVEYRPSDVGSWTTDQTVSRDTESATVDGLRNGEEYDLRVVAQTEHDSVEDT